MPSGRNSVYAPHTSPVFDPGGIRADRRFTLPGANELPPFSVTGFVTGIGTSPGFPVRTPGTIRQCVVTVEATGGTSVAFDMLLNGAVVTSHVASTAGETFHIESIPVVLNDIIVAEITDCGSGGLYNLLIVLRL